MTCWGTSSVTCQAGEEQGRGRGEGLTDWGLQLVTEVLPGQPSLLRVCKVKHIET